MKAFIIDDELNSRELLQKMLENYCEGIEVMGMADNAQQGIDLIRSHELDLVFLDLELPGGDGMAVLDAFPDPDFQFVLVTGYSQKKLLLPETNIAAWIHKPVHLSTLRKTLANLLPELPQTTASQPDAQTHPKQKPEEKPGVILPGTGNYGRLPYSEVAYVEAHRAYALFHLASGEKRLASHPLAFYENILPEETFFRIHKSYLVNVNHVKAYDAGKGGQLYITNGSSLPIAVRRKPAFIRFFKSLSKGS